MRTLVEQFMEEQGLPMPKNFKRQSLEEYVQWRQGKVKNAEFEAELRCHTK